MDETRHARLESRILQELSTMLMKGEIKDHRVDTLVSFSYIKLAKDAATARIGVSTVLDNKNHAARAVEGLNSAAGYLQGRLGKLLKTRTAPLLRFVEDHSLKEAQAVISRIDEAVRTDQEIAAASRDQDDQNQDDHDQRNPSAEQTPGD
ncbi:hypothetical protein AU468_14090 [Alkalispirochaeta sphaeroplastigenens]|uniref:Ribosome-binding factor A n=1 Tax=Alkalispirochaeta sphaeroplastigenens TaxID=1187066 RepID=A0A2S4JF99_9SPIO|nr:30S ribosome-binding factor RbfA [Alkalispirochaeta sphaeroplastigenens]POQ98237.1 hypothetical protein AU468_14090 [Alkalispirochaeta sphaeroplastigenens]